MSKHALLVIDVQSGLIRGAYQETEVLAAINNTCKSVRASGGVIIFIQHCHTSYEPLMKGHPDWALHESLDVQADDLFIEKQASDSFYGTNLEELLNQLGISHVYVTGLQTEYCVDTTCRSAMSKGFEVTLISDGHTTGDALLKAPQTIAHHNAVLENLAHPHRAIQVRASYEV